MGVSIQFTILIMNKGKMVLQFTVSTCIGAGAAEGALRPFKQRHLDRVTFCLPVRTITYRDNSVNQFMVSVKPVSTGFFCDDL